MGMPSGKHTLEVVAMIPGGPPSEVATLDIIATVGVHFQLTKRSGKTNRQLRQEAKQIVYGSH